MWLRDGLPHDIPCVRVILYGYTTPLETNSQQTIVDLSRGFLSRFRPVRLKQMSAKPVIYVAHSPNGIVLKGAMIGDLQYLAKTRACLFFGAPNKGMSNEKLLPMVKGIHPTERLIEQLAEKSDYLEDNSSRFEDLQDKQISVL